MRILGVLVLLTYCTAFAGGGGGGGYVVNDRERIFECTGKSLDGRRTSVEFFREQRTYDESDGETAYTMIVKSKGQKFELESTRIEDLFQNGKIENGSVVRSIIEYWKPTGHGSLSSESAEIEANLVPGKGGTLKIWDYLYEDRKEERGELLASLELTDCLRD